MLFTARSWASKLSIRESALPFAPRDLKEMPRSEASLLDPVLPEVDRLDISATQPPQLPNPSLPPMHKIEHTSKEFESYKSIKLLVYEANRPLLDVDDG